MKDFFVFQNINGGERILLGESDPKDSSNGSRGIVKVQVSSKIVVST